MNRFQLLSLGTQNRFVESFLEKNTEFCVSNKWIIRIIKIRPTRPDCQDLIHFARSRQLD